MTLGTMARPTLSRGLLPSSLSGRPSIAATGWRSARSSRQSTAYGFSVERPPVVLEWGSWVLRVGHAEQHRPQHILPWDSTRHHIRSEEEWYSVILPLLSRVWDRLMIDPASRRVVCVANPYMPSAWEAAMKQALWNLGVPAVCFVSCLEAVPYAMGWSRGLVVHVGRHEAQCLVIADGHALHNTYQVVPCGYETVVPSAGNFSTVQVKWDGRMNKHWLDERNPSSLMLAVLKCLEACPLDTRKDVVSNLVFAGDALVLVPDLARQVRERLVPLLTKSAAEFDEEPTSELTIVPTQWDTLSPLSSHVAVTSTAPLRPDLVSWIGASLWVTVWHRHDDNDACIKWTRAPKEKS